MAVQESAAMPTVLACGAWLKNAACLLGENGAAWSANHGDLGDPASRSALAASLDHLHRVTTAPIAAVAHDLHPDFFSTQIAREMAHELAVPAIAVQHHHAHVAAVRAEHGVREAVIGVALDGYGYGSDGEAWGGELLWVDDGCFRRLGHLRPLPLPGGDAAAREPWRMAVAALCELGRADETQLRFSGHVDVVALNTVQRMTERRINSPMTTSAGRLFDAAAGAIGICLRQQNEADAAIRLEQTASAWLLQNNRALDEADLSLRGAEASVLDTLPLIATLLDGGVAPHSFDAGRLAAWFHLALADSVATWTAAACRQQSCGVVCLGGGCFFNALLRDRVVSRLRSRGLTVLLPRQYSCGDAGLAFGQAWVAVEQLRRGLPRDVADSQRPRDAFVVMNESAVCV